MEKRSLGRRIWEIINPILVSIGISFVVNEVISLFMTFQYLPQILNKIDGQVDVIQQMEILEEQAMQIQILYIEFMEKYGVEITAVSALLTIPILIIMKRFDARKDRKAGLLENKKAPLYKYFLIVGVSIPAALVANNIITLSNLAEYSLEYQKTAEILYSPSFPVQIICTGVIIPIFEEYVFRGLIYKRMRRDKSFVGAMISSAIIFGIYHSNLVQFVYATLLGLLLAYLYEKYGSLKAPILAHMLTNIVMCILTKAGAFTWMFSQLTRMAFITIACAAIGSSVFLLVSQIDEKPEELQNIEN